MEWKEQGAEKVYDCPVFDVYRSYRVSPLGVEGEFYTIDLPDWVTVIPEVYDTWGRACFLMVEQYRHGSGRVTIEFPAGSIDPGELPETAGVRELLEETGYRPGSMEALAAVNPNPALMNNASHIYLARNLIFEREQRLDHAEEINYYFIPVKEVVAKMGVGAYDNAIMMTALAFYLRRQNSFDAVADRDTSDSQ